MDSLHKNTFKNLLSLLVLVFLGFMLFQFLLLVLELIKGQSYETLTENPQIIIDSYQGKDLLILQMLSHVFALILPALALSLWKKEVGHSLSPSSPTIGNLWLSLFFFFACIPLVTLSAHLNQLIPLPDWMSQTEDKLSDLIKRMLSMNSMSDLLVAIIVIGVVPAIGEEWIFRGIIQSQLRRIFPSSWVHILLSALIFSAIHLQFEGFLPRFLLGAILGFVYRITGHLLYPMLLHFIFNSSQVMTVYFLGPEAIDQLDKPSGSGIMIWIYGIGSAILATFIGSRMIQSQNQNTYA